MNLRGYIFPLSVFVVGSGQSFLLYQFLVSNYRIPEGSVFGFSTLMPLLLGITLSVIVFLAVLPQYKSKITEGLVQKRYYWVVMALIILLSLILTVYSIGIGGIEYTQFQASYR